MPTALLDARLSGTDIDTAFARITDFAAYPSCSDTVREVLVTPSADGHTTSRWSVNFRSGILCWTELDRIDATALRVDFCQTEGDFELLDGSWQLDRDGDDVVVQFRARFDLGIPTLAAIIDPLAERAFVHTISSALLGLLGDQVRITKPS